MFLKRSRVNTFLLRQIFSMIRIKHAGFLLLLILSFQTGLAQDGSDIKFGKITAADFQVPSPKLIRDPMLS